MSIFSKNKPEKAENIGTEAANSETASQASAAKISKHPKKVKRNVDKRNRSLKTISVVSTILFLVILLVFNIVFDKLLGARLKWDWSTGGQYSIGDITEGIIGDMAKDVQIIGLFDKESDANYTKVQPMIEEYAKKSNNRITVRYVDPVKFPNIIKEVDPDGYLDLQENTFVVYCPETKKAKQLAYADIYDIQMNQSTYEQYINGVTAEESITGAIKYVMSATTPSIYFTTGHDELNYASDYSIMVSIFKNNNFDVKSIDLFDLTAIPEDCATLVIAAPKKDISSQERAMLQEYLKKGGGLLVAVDYNTTEFTELNTLLSDFNIEISNDKIREGNKDYRYQDDAYFLRAIAPSCSITPTAVNGLTLMNNVRGINKLKDEKEMVTVESALTTSEEGVIETNGDVNQSSEPGTQTIGLVSENERWIASDTQTSAKVMVVGSSGIFSDSILNISSRLYNAYTFFYGAQWLADTEETESLYIESKSAVSYSVTKGTTSTHVMVAVLVMALIPGALLLIALFVYRKRKHL